MVHMQIVSGRAPRESTCSVLSITVAPIPELEANSGVWFAGESQVVPGKGTAPQPQCCRDCIHASPGGGQEICSGELAIS